jgi:hypothetical protein
VTNKDRAIERARRLETAASALREAMYAETRLFAEDRDYVANGVFTSEKLSRIDKLFVEARQTAYHAGAEIKEV